MKEIPLTRGKTALVDDADFEKVGHLKWRAVPLHRCWYALRDYQNPEGKRSTIMLHRQILGDSIPGFIDHKNHNGLDCQRENLRPATRSQNGANGRLRGTAKSSQFKGVCWHVRSKKWQAQLHVDLKQIYLGSFSNETRAAQAYDIAARSHFGEFALLNFS